MERTARWATYVAISDRRIRFDPADCERGRLFVACYVGTIDMLANFMFSFALSGNGERDRPLAQSQTRRHDPPAACLRSLKKTDCCR